MQITIVTPYLPFPAVAHGGGQDLFQLIRELGSKHEIRLASFADSAQASMAETLLSYVVDMRLVRPAIRMSDKLSNALVAAKKGAFHMLGRRADTEMRLAIRGWPADVLHCAWTEMGRYLSDAPRGSIKVLEEVDVRFLAESTSKRSRYKMRRRRREELAYCRTADLVIARSNYDLDSLRVAIPDLNGLVIPPVAHVQQFLDISREGSVPGRVLFVGAMVRRRNQEAANWLAREVWPIVLASCPGATLRIVGADPPARVEAFSRIPGITVTGFVPDLRQEYQQARVVVAPLRSPAGALNKVLDGLAAGRPVVGTTLANSGIGAPPQAMWLADSAADFAHGISQLLLDEVEWKRVSFAGRNHVRQQFDWPVAVRRYEETLLSLVHARQARQLQ